MNTKFSIRGIADTNLDIAFMTSRKNCRKKAIFVNIINSTSLCSHTLMTVACQRLKVMSYLFNIHLNFLI